MHQEDSIVNMIIFHTDQKNIAEIRVEKHRNGPTGFVKLTFVPHCTRFEDYFPQVYDGVGEY